MKKNFFILLSILILSLCFSFNSNAAVKINKSKITLEVGKTTTLKLKGTKKKPKWSSNRKLVATVDQKGKITAKSAGTATISAKLGKKTYKCKVNVTVPNYNNKLEILAEYTLPDSLKWYTRHFYVVKNNSNKTLDIQTSSIAYSNDGKIISSANGELHALGAGCTSIFYEAFETSEDISKYETNLTATPSKYYKSVMQDLTYVKNDIQDGAVIQVTNKGNYAAQFVEGYALFFLNGNLVDYDTCYFTDNDYEIKPGNTISKQMTSYKNFDTMDIYLTGRR